MRQLLCILLFSNRYKCTINDEEQFGDIIKRNFYNDVIVKPANHDNNTDRLIIADQHQI